ncbi:hypothetical protein GCM10010129_78390 [Streptomyces fumigatiscleroticus]|nr:hypothetical protein GCM10010129_78390 [Streptomyces fumigatiscleroticus]
MNHPALSGPGREELAAVMRYSPRADVVARVLPSGALVLTDGQRRVHYLPEATAMWIALREQGGEALAAAARLAAAWDEDPELVHTELMRMVEQWGRTGFLRSESRAAS